MPNALDALRTYGQHQSRCKKIHGEFMSGKCTCGLDDILSSLHHEKSMAETSVEEIRIRAYRQARVFEPNAESYHAAMSVYSAAFGKPDGEVTVVLPDEHTKQGWELDAGASESTLRGLITMWRKAAKDFGINPFSDAHCLRTVANELEALLPAPPIPCTNCGHVHPHTGSAGDVDDACTVPGCNCGYFSAPKGT